MLWTVEIRAKDTNAYEGYRRKLKNSHRINVIFWIITEAINGYNLKKNKCY